MEKSKREKIQLVLLVTIAILVRRKYRLDIFGREKESRVTIER